MSLGKVIKSLSDKRIYKALALKNEIQCLLISDKDAQKSSAALSVGVGSLLDPLEAQGLAHYLEHMLFMGTEKYPEENQYSSYLSKNAGSSNAYTSQQQTNYFFEVSHAAFTESLDRFSQFFISPLMLDASSERELNAVHSEHSKNLLNDSWRKYQLSKAISKQDHPYAKFSTGDKTSLANPNLRDMLFKFYNANYSSNLMKLVVYGQQDIEILEKEVESRFSLVPHKKYQSYQMLESPFGQNALKKLIKLVPVKDKRTLELTWVLKNKSPFYRSAPSKYISHLLGHEGKGSLLSFLMAEGLGTGLSAGGNDNYNCYSEFEVSITLTDRGLTKIKQIIGYVLYFIEMLKLQKPQEWVIEEIQRVNKMKFDFIEKKQGMSYCSSIAKNLHRKPIEEILRFPYLMDQFQPNLIHEYLEELSLDNLIVMAESKTYQNQCQNVEKIYGTKYNIQDLGKIPSLPCAVSLPEKNIFIPQNLDILPLGTALHPEKIYSSKTIEAYYKADHQFELPKAEINLRLYFDAQNSVKEQLCRTLFGKMLKEKLRQFVYMAEMADLGSEFDFGSYYTLNLKIDGFRDSFNNFINYYLTSIFSFIPDDLQLFETLKEKQQKEYANYFLNNPYQLAYNTIVGALREGSSVSPKDKLKEISNIQLADIQAYATYWRKRIFSEIFISGNLQRSHAEHIVKNVEKLIESQSERLPLSDIGAIRPIFLPLEKVSVIQDTLISKEEVNSSLIVHFQYEEMKLKTKILQDLVLAFVKEPAFDYLRTKEQLGYIVMCLPDDNRGVMGLSLLVQSNVKNSYELTTYIDQFIHTILKQKIEELDQKTFQEYKAALLSTKLQKDKTLSSESARFWTEIVKHAFEFKRKQLQIELIPTITLQELKQFMNILFYKNQRILEVHMISQNTMEQCEILRKERVSKHPNLQIYTDSNSFRKRMSLYPDYYSHL